MKTLFIKILLICFSLFLLFSFFFPIPVFAKQQTIVLPVITVINPIRGRELGLEKADLLTSFKEQWRLTHEKEIKATWLWQYSGMNEKQLVDFAKEQMADQEFGIFFEIDKQLAGDAHVVYRGQGPWYFSDGLLLMSYDKDERIKLIDAAFLKFKQTFGYYPKIVGAWWIGGDSLSYMQKKYGVVAALRAADQYHLDVYSIWGTPWSIPYVASSQNQAIPADDTDSSHVVILQWAVRDPTKGYDDPIYSIQDFSLYHIDNTYVDYIMSVFLKKPFDNIVIGLENGTNANDLARGYGMEIAKAKNLEEAGKIVILPAKEYAEQFLQQRATFAGSNYLLSKDYFSDDQSFWYNSENYRAGVRKEGTSIYLVDLRNYATKVSEDFDILNNSQGYLRISTPAIIDSGRFPKQKILIAKDSDTLKTIISDDEVTLSSGNKKIAEFSKDSLALFLDNGSLKTYTFSKHQKFENILYLLTFLYAIYVLFLFRYTKDILKTFVQFFLLLIPFILAYPFLFNTSIFDRKELFLISLLPSSFFISIGTALLWLKVAPFLFLLLSHVLFLVSSKKIFKIIFIFCFVFVTFLFAHISYMPLDKTTYVPVAVFFFLFTCITFVGSFVLFKKTKSKRLLVISLLLIPFALFISGVTVYISRTKILLPSFEMDALQMIKEQRRDVIFVSETDYGIKPIYKAVKPLLYENYHLGEKLSGTHWQIVERPENNVLQLSGYDQKLIVVPRYLGADLSDNEMKLLGLENVLDNGQIAIFKKH